MYTLCGIDLPVEKSYYCCADCFSNEWKRHMVSHQHAVEAVNTDNKKSGRELRSCGSQEVMPFLQQKEKEWIEVGSLESYVPTSDDLGSILRLVSVAVDPETGAQLTAMNIIETNPVITGPVSQPRQMINCIPNDPNHSSDEMTFSVLSYNVLADIYTRINDENYNYCPSWALVWEYRRQKLFDEIIKYDADILCLQEVVFIVKLAFFFFPGFSCKIGSWVCLLLSDPLALTLYLVYLAGAE